MEPIRLSLKRAETPIILETVDGVEKAYKLREMLGKDRDTYLTRMGDKVRYNANGKVTGIKSFDGLQASLLEKCLYDENDHLVSLTDIQNFPTKTQNELFKLAQELNGLNQKAENESKNDLGESG